MSSSYYTTSLLPSGNRLVTDVFCPILLSNETTTTRSPQVHTQSLAAALDFPAEESGSSSLNWVVGSPLQSPGDWSQFWLLMDTKSQYLVTCHTDAVEGDDVDFNDKMEVTAWPSADSARRPLVISNNEFTANVVGLDNATTTTTPTEFLPLPHPPVLTSPFSAAVPTPDGGLLLLESNNNAGGTSSSYQLTQLVVSPATSSTGGWQDVTHKSLLLMVRDPLPDTQWAYSASQQKWALYTQATNRYDHGVIGDELEGNALTVLQWNNVTQQVEFHSQRTLDIDIDEPAVFEGRGPMWADVNGDGHDDLLTTVSDSNVGARLRVYSLTTTKDDDDADSSFLQILAQAPAIGLGGRWLHQLAVGPLGPNGEQEIVEIRTPHIGGIVRYYQFQNSTSSSSDAVGELKLVASISPFTSHDIRSRNLDRAVVGDFNGDGIPELVVQTQDKQSLVGLQRSHGPASSSDGDGGVALVWSIPLPSPVESNLGVSCTSAGSLEIMFGTRNQELVRLQFLPDGIQDEGNGGGSNNDEGGSTVDTDSDTVTSEARTSSRQSVHSNIYIMCVSILLWWW